MGQSLVDLHQNIKCEDKPVLKKMFVKSPLGKSYFSAPGQIKCSQDVFEFLSSKGENLGSEGKYWRCEQNGKPMREGEVFPSDSVTVYVLPEGGLPGGKGGFGSLLRAIGAQIEKTTNHEAMRDLSGRRQRDVNNEQRVRDYVSKQGEREREDREKKEAKLEKLRRLTTGENKDKHSFSDPMYDKARSEVEEKVHDAVEAAMKVSKDSTAKASDVKEGEEVSNKRKNTNIEAEPSKKKVPKGLWIGDGLDGLGESDLSDSSDEEVEEDKKAVALT